MKRVLLITFHYPPFQGSSGTLRALNFSRYLAEFGWEPIVLTARPSAYGAVSEGSRALAAPPGVEVMRAFALDAARDLSIKGRYPGFLALPDRWSSWAVHALWLAMRAVSRYRPALIWSTYPIATAHLVGRLAQRLSGLPWVADFRDSMTEDEYPRDPVVRRAYQRIEAAAVERARRVVFTTPGTMRMYAERYPELPDTHWQVIANGYDEEAFSRLGVEPARSKGGTEGPLTFLHSGVLYPDERDPQPFFAALANLKRLGRVSALQLRVVLRATAHDDVIGRMVQSFGLDDIVELAPAIPYQDALSEMLRADALLIFQAANCNHQIPAKLYEYMRCGRPILALTDERGDTAATLRAAGVGDIADLSDADDIGARLLRFLELLRAGRAPVPDPDYARTYTRRAQAGQLARLFDSVYAERA